MVRFQAVLTDLDGRLRKQLRILCMQGRDTLPTPHCVCWTLQAVFLEMWLRSLLPQHHITAKNGHTSGIDLPRSIDSLMQWQLLPRAVSRSTALRMSAPLYGHAYHSLGSIEAEISRSTSLFPIGALAVEQIVDESPPGLRPPSCGSMGGLQAHAPVYFEKTWFAVNVSVP